MYTLSSIRLRHTAFWVLLARFIYAPPLWAQEPIQIVRDVKAELVARHFDFHLVPESDPDGSEPSRCGAAAITWRVASRLAQRKETVFLIAKTAGQNGCTYTADGKRYSHDAIIYQGQCVDVLFRSETQNVPAWNYCAETPDPTNWRQPFALDDVVPPPPPPPEPIDLTPILNRLDTLEAMTKEVWTAIAITNERAEAQAQRQTRAEMRIDELQAGLDLLAARPIYASCRAAIFGIPVSCRLER